jgi:hypothetical protein
VRADLRRYYGCSLGALFSGEISPDEVWDLVLHLPRESATTAALYADPATVLSDEPSEPQLTEYPPVVEAIAALYDVNVAILAHLSAFTSKKPVRLAPYRRPGEARRKAVRAAKRDQARQEWNELLGQLGIAQ